MNNVSEDPRPAMNSYRQVAARLYRYMLHFKGPLIWFYIVSACAAVLAAFVPRVLGLMTTSIFAGVMEMASEQAAGLDFAYLARIAAILLCLFAAAYFFQYMQGRIMTRITNRSTYLIRKDIAAKQHRLSLEYVHAHDAAEIMSHVTNDADVIAFSFNQAVTQATNTVFAVIAAAAVMFSINVSMALLVSAVLPITALGAYMAWRTAQPQYELLQNRMRDMEVFLRTAYDESNGRRTAPYCSSDSEEFSAINAQIRRASERAQFRSGVLRPAVSALSVFAYIGVCVMGSLLAVQGTITIGDVQAFIQYVRSFTHPVEQMASAAGPLQRTLSAAKRIFAFLDLDEEDLANVPAHAVQTPGVLSFDHVVMRDGPENAKPFSLDVAPGTIVWVTGPSGAGKTQFIETALGLKPPRSGSIRFGGVPVQDSGCTLGFADSSAWAVDGTIEDNIWLTNCTDHAGRRIAHELSPDSEWTMDKPVGEHGRNLSTGELQLLQIARLLTPIPQIYAVDDALGALDAQALTKVLQMLQSEGEGSIGFIVSPDARTAQFADVILYVDHGCISVRSVREDRNKPAMDTGNPLPEPSGSGAVSPQSKSAQDSSAGPI